MESLGSTTFTFCRKVAEKPFVRATLEDFERFSACYCIWNNNNFLPADIKTAIAIRKMYPKYHSKWGIVYLFGLLGKEPGLQWQLAHAAEAYKANDPTIKQEAGLIRQVVTKYWEACMTKGRKQETKNLTARGTGWPTILHRMKFTSKAEVADSGSLAWRAWDAKSAAALNAVRASSQELASIDAKLLGNVGQWNSAWEALEPKLAFPGCGDLSTYVKPWIFRIWAVVSMRTANVSRLACSTSMTPALFSKGYPDQSDWILRFGVGFDSMAELWSHMGYAGPPELFSMFCCFFGSKSARKFSAAWIFANRAAIAAARSGYVAGWGHEPTPSTVLELTRSLISDLPLARRNKE